MMEYLKKIKNELIALALLIVIAVSVVVINEKLEKRHSTKVINEMVESGELTPEQGDAILWLWYEYKPRKYKKHERQN